MRCRRRLTPESTVSRWRQCGMPCKTVSARWVMISCKQSTAAGHSVSLRQKLIVRHKKSSSMNVASASASSRWSNLDAESCTIAISRSRQVPKNRLWIRLRSHAARRRRHLRNIDGSMMSGHLGRSQPSHEYILCAASDRRRASPCTTRYTPNACGDLYGQSPRNVGMIVVRTRKPSDIVTMVVITPATEVFRLQRRSKRPAKKSAIATWRRMGKRAMVNGTFHLTKPSWRS